jgi:hypothetical protein
VLLQRQRLPRRAQAAATSAVPCSLLSLWAGRSSGAGWCRINLMKNVDLFFEGEIISMLYLYYFDAIFMCQMKNIEIYLWAKLF